jgi:hypothetical protein
MSSGLASQEASEVQCGKRPCAYRTYLQGAGHGAVCVIQQQAEGRHPELQAEQLKAPEVRPPPADTCSCCVLRGSGHLPHC